MDHFIRMDISVLAAAAGYFLSTVELNELVFKLWSFYLNYWFDDLFFLWNETIHTFQVSVDYKF